MANYRKPAPAFVKQRLKFAASAKLTTHLSNSHEPSDSEPFSPPRIEHDSGHGATMSDRLLFSMGGASMIFAFLALAMLWPV